MPASRAAIEMTSMSIVLTPTTRNSAPQPYPKRGKVRLMGRVIAAAAYSAGRKIADITVEESGEWAARPGHFVWIGIEAPSERDLRQLQIQFGLHELALEDALNAHQRPKLETY